MRIVSKQFRLIALFGVGVLIGLPFAFQNCTEARLKPISIQASSAGTVCTRTPTNFESLQRFIFILDMSYSVNGVDGANPLTRRVEGLKKFIDAAKNDDNVTMSLGVIYENTAYFINPAQSPPTPPAPAASCGFYKPRVATDNDLLNVGLDQLREISKNTKGITSYLSAMNTVSSCIDMDKTTASGANYNVVLVTDGAPNDGSPSAIQDSVARLIASGRANPADEKQISRINLFLVLLTDAFTQNSDEALLIESIFTRAQNSGGYRSQYLVEKGPDPVDYTKLNAFLRPNYYFKQVFATNMNAAIDLKSGLLATDSDGDGVSDNDETQFKTDPIKFASTDQCNDLIFHKNGTCRAICTAGQNFADTDHDGLSDCDEQSIGSNRFNPDSDKDVIFDGLEFRIGSNPRDPGDASSDSDFDGFTNLQEAVKQTHVMMDDRSIPHTTGINLSYKLVSETTTQRCYDIQISKMPVFPTKAVQVDTIGELRHKDNENVVKIMIFQAPDDLPNAPTSLLFTTRVLQFKSGTTDSATIDGLKDSEFDLYVTPP